MHLNISIAVIPSTSSLLAILTVAAVARESPSDAASPTGRVSYYLEIIVAGEAYMKILDVRRISESGSYGAGGEPRPAREPTYTLKATGDAAKNYDFLAARPPGKRQTIIEASGHLAKSALGAGICVIHMGFKNCGLWTAFVLSIFLGLLVGYCMYVLAKSAQKAYGMSQTAEMSYPDLAQCAFEICKFNGLKKWARAFRYCVDVTIMLDLFGACCCYQIIISKTVLDTIKHFTGNEPNLRIVILLVAIPIILLCMIRTLKYLAPFSIVADLVIVTVAICTVVYGIQNATYDNRSPFDMPVFTSFGKMLIFISNCVFAMEGVGVTLPIENNMKEPKKIGLVLIYGMGIIIIMVVTVGFFGYWGFGDLCQEPVTLNFPTTGFAIFLKISLAAMVWVTFALNFWVPFELAWDYIKKRHRSTEKININNIERIYRIIFIIAITLVSVIFPDANKLVAVIGSFCLTNMGFIYPALIELLLDWDDPGLGKMKWRLWRFLAILIFSVFVMVLGTIEGVVDLIKFLQGKTSTRESFWVDHF
ncbi:proton-coupled amino acid transporter-like protein pathetic [Pectinophora gossypiella]|uniref:proton-coupled amino acid transporter-like protein pathetic n=1 Tax=Pectinophora gossypiella TaxID=13191 RepID=UPI00214EA44F|nr:proton-coupled amino acid transporter-like protein pathetic [Pectinophora gossypiella]